MKITRIIAVEAEFVYDTEDDNVEPYVNMSAEEDAELMANEVKDLLGAKSTRVVSVRELKD